jgi:hypothetical protein
MTGRADFPYLPDESHSTKITESTPRSELTPKQTQVIAALGTGHTVTDAGRLGRVDRTTIYLWLQTDAVFVAELNREPQDRKDAVRRRVRELVPDALNGLADLLKPDASPAVRLRAIMFVLQAYGVPGGEAIGLTDAEAIEADWRHAEATQRHSDFLDSLTP